MRCRQHQPTPNPDCRVCRGLPTADDYEHEIGWFTAEHGHLVAMVARVEAKLIEAETDKGRLRDLLGKVHTWIIDRHGPYWGPSELRDRIRETRGNPAPRCPAMWVTTVQPIEQHCILPMGHAGRHKADGQQFHDAQCGRSWTPPTLPGPVRCVLPQAHAGNHISAGYSYDDWTGQS